MAGGKQTPRQKMINLMYLVFIAMLALNMGKEVLNAFGMMNERLGENTERTTERNEALMAGLAAKASEQPEKFAKPKENAQKIQELGDDLVSYIEKVKTDLKSNVTPDENGEYDYTTMDKADYLDQMFFRSGKITEEGQTLINKIDAYRKNVVGLIEDPTIRAEVEEKFSTEEIDVEGGKQPWLNYEFEGFPLIASLTKFSQMQADVRTTESEVLSALMQDQLISDASMKNYKAIVVADKSAFFSGENFSGKVVLARYDDTQTFDDVKVNGNKITTVENGQIVLDFPAGNIGEQKIAGEINFAEGDSTVTIPIEGSYAVIPKPNSAVISADKMNVVYRGVKNPMTISIPGVPTVNASAPGLTKTGSSSYVMDVTNVQAREVSIKVSGNLPSGESVSDSKKFRIKEIPRPVGVIGVKDGADGIIRMPRNQVEISPIGATLPDFDFDLNLTVSGFKFQVTGKPAVQVNGNRLTGSAKAALAGAKRGATVQIFDIQAKIAGNSSYKLPKVAPLVIELTN